MKKQNEQEEQFDSPLSPMLGYIDDAVRSYSEVTDMFKMKEGKANKEKKQSDQECVFDKEKIYEKLDSTQKAILNTNLYTQKFRDLSDKVKKELTMMRGTEGKNTITLSNQEECTFHYASNIKRNMENIVTDIQKVYEAGADKLTIYRSDDSPIIPVGKKLVKAKKEVSALFKLEIYVKDLRDEVNALEEAYK
ncbi:hypothetical protein K9L67_03295 [Candidatus Woesearchaeota archaeon]|nr:hypothetical protein [Candidatus Woesearchaeota archaeon]MCF7901227.1 hypothetical protein [Candidatus Woesearchaeota archaeon]MCF8013756.1 hypothetical protein [Candidatus Woesearchaeota archaeon]